jgi:hypothetical protein
MIVFPRLFGGTPMVPGPEAFAEVVRWGAVLVQSLDNFRSETLSTFPRINSGRGISLEGRVRLNSSLTDPDSIVDPLVGEMRYNQNSDKFQGYVADTGGGSPGWVDLH